MEVVVELRMRPLLAYCCKRNGPHFFMYADQKELQVVDASSDCKYHVTWKLGLIIKANKIFLEIAKVLKILPSLKMHWPMISKIIGTLEIIVTKIMVLL